MLKYLKVKLLKFKEEIKRETNMTEINSSSIIPIVNEVIRKLNKQNIYPTVTEIKSLVSAYILNILVEIENNDIVIYGLCEEFKNNKDVY
jgi:hypothetical protein